MSFTNIRYCNVVVEIIPQGTGFGYIFVCCGQKDLAQMPFSLRCAQHMVTSILQDQQYIFVLKIAHRRESVADDCCWSLCCFHDRCNDLSDRFPHAVM